MCCEVIVFETVDDDTQKMSFFYLGLYMVEIISPTL